MRRMRISDEGLMNLGFAVHLGSMFTFRQGNSDVARMGVRYSIMKRAQV